MLSLRSELGERQAYYKFILSFAYYVTRLIGFYSTDFGSFIQQNKILNMLKNK